MQTLSPRTTRARLSASRPLAWTPGPLSEIFEALQRSLRSTYLALPRQRGPVVQIVKHFLLPVSWRLESSNLCPCQAYTQLLNVTSSKSLDRTRPDTGRFPILGATYTAEMKGELPSLPPGPSALSSRLSSP
jgi:hypothetical protein